MRWDNDSLAEIDSLYVKQAFEKEKWAFVSDYIRLYATHKYGGIYMDTDVELTASLDKFLEHDFFLGSEKIGNGVGLMTGIIGSSPRHPIAASLLAQYDNKPFILPNGDLDQTANPAIFWQCLSSEYGLTMEKYRSCCRTCILNIMDNVPIYPYWYFCTPEPGKPNYAIHHFAATWVDSYRRKTKLKIGKYSLIRFKKSRRAKDDKLPIYSDEKLVCLICVSKKKKYGIIKR